jgi:hypothetical protein
MDRDFIRYNNTKIKRDLSYPNQKRNSPIDIYDPFSWVEYTSLTIIAINIRLGK